MRRQASAALAIVAMTVAATAQADERQDCLDAAVRGQELQKQGKLHDARTALAQCAKPECPGLVSRDCTRWLEEVDTAMPSIVVAVREADGSDVLDGRATIDGIPAPDAIAGKPVELDPGDHVIRIERPNRAPLEERIIVREGEQRRTIVVRAPPVALPPREPEHHITTRVRAPTPVATFILGAIGLAAIGGFAVAGLKGVIDRADLHCDTGCSSGANNQVQTEFVIADVMLPVGIACLGAALLVHLLRGYRTVPVDVSLGPGGAAWRVAF